jgi:adhesin transport system outer membrane protein
VERAKSEIASRRARLFDTQDSLLIDVARTMFEVLRAQSSARVLESSLEVQQARVDDARARRDVGFARPIDVSLIEAEAADTRVELVEAQRLSITGTSLLEFLTGAALEGVVLDGTLEMPEPPPVEEWLAQARKQRQDFIAAEASVDAATHAVEVASGQWWPSLSVDLAAFLSRDSSPTDQDWSALIALHLPLFSAGRIRADVRDALSFLREAKLASSLTERAVRRDVEVAWENLRASRERVERLQVRLAAATEAFAQADGLYDAGLGTNLERLIAQDQMIASQLAHESAKLDVQIFYLNLVRSAGGLSAWIGLERPDPDAKTAEEDARAEAR